MTRRVSPVEISFAWQEFKDAIESLSPEQKRFATAVRSMQLESSVFGVCVVQLKPQLEALLGLDDDALTKEIKLTQDLLSLFIEYQIPSDLLTFDDREGSGAATPSEKVEAVKGHVAAVQEMLAAARAAEIAEEEEKARLEKERAAAAKAERERALGVVSQNAVAFGSAASSGGFGGFGSAPSARGFGGFGSAASAGGFGFGSAASAGGFGGSRSGGGFSFGAPAGGGGFAQSASAYSAEGPFCKPGQAESALTAGYDSAYSTMESDMESLRSLDRAPAPAAAPATDVPSVPVAEAAAEEAQVDGEAVDLTQIPKQLDAQFEALDEDSSLRPTVIKTGVCARARVCGLPLAFLSSCGAASGETWTKRAQKSLLGKLVQSSMNSTAQKTEKDKAFDLLDALSRSVRPAPCISWEPYLLVQCAQAHRQTALREWLCSRP